MDWYNIILDQHTPGTELVPRLDALFAQQRESWAMFRDGETALSSIQTKVLSDGNSQVIVQANPRRKRSTHAKVDTKSLANRPCFLCLENLPAEERGIAFGDLVILPNPYPVLRRHCTIPGRTHQPQRLTDRVGTMIELACEIGPEMLVFYNGPQCGASAPDHFHLQACDASDVPLLDELPKSDDSSVQTYASFGRRIFLFFGRSSESVQQNIERAVEAMSRQLSAGEEPLLSLFVFCREGQVTGVLTPRAIHRPACYFLEGDQQIAVSPATLEMAGVVIVSEADHFDRVDATVMRNIYQEVCLDEASFARLAEAIR